MADLIIEIEHDSKDLMNFFREYIINNQIESSFIVKIKSEDIKYEENKSNIDAKEFDYLKMAIYRKIAEELPKYNAFLFHGSALYIDNKAIILTGKSGVGKSTHARLLKEYYNVHMINDDKPLIRIINDTPYVYGTPYNGKHHLSENVRKELSDIINVNQSSNIKIEKLDKKISFNKLLFQTYKPSNKNSLSKTLELLNKLNIYTDSYNLYCDISKQAADLTYSTIYETKH